VDISHKFLRALPLKYEMIVTLLVRSNLKTITPSEVLGEVLTHDIFKQSQEEFHGNLHDGKKKIMAFKAKASNDDESYASTDDDIASMAERFKKFMKRKGYHGVDNKSGKSYGKNPFSKKKCFECREMGHISTKCKKEENSSKSKKFEGKKKLFKKYIKKKNGKACYVEWDSDASSDSNSNAADDDAKPSKKGLVSIAIKEAPSLSNTPYCLVAKCEPKVYDDDDDEFSYDDLVEMVSNLDNLFGDMKRKYRDLKKKHASLQDSYEELKTSHENLLETHQKVKEAHNSHISQEANKVKVNVGTTCDLLDDLPSIETISKSSNSTSYDDLFAIPCSSNVDSCMNDSYFYEPLLVVENDELKNTIHCLVKALANCHRG
jgi:archaellum component FlaC